MTEEQINICTAFGCVNCLPGNWDKRFIKNLHQLALDNPDQELSENQEDWMYKMLYKYRRQLEYCFRTYGKHPKCKKA